MSQNKRQFFRMNVELPLYIQPFDTNSNKPSSIPLPSKKNQVYQQAHSQLLTSFKDESHIKNGAVELFSNINRRLEFLVWLLDLLIEGKDPKDQKEYFQRLDQDRLILLPEGNGKSSVFPLIHSLFYQVDELISGLIDTVEHSVEGHVFLFTRPVREPFSGTRYLHNIDTLASNGVWLAKVIQNLIIKLNLYEQAYCELKESFKDLSYPERWPVTAVNLSTGGLAFETEKSYTLNDEFCILLQMEEQIIYAKAKVVAIHPIGSDDKRARATARHRVSFSFLVINPSSTARITQFVTAQELAFAHPELK